VTTRIKIESQAETSLLFYRKVKHISIYPQDVQEI